MKEVSKHKILTVLISSVWLMNGLVFKVLNWVPRHEEIVSRILGQQYARPLTLSIGLSEIVLGIWILTGRYSKINACFQIGAVAGMNILEFILVPDLLLWGRLNSFFAFMFILIIYYNEFILNTRINSGKVK